MGMKRRFFIEVTLSRCDLTSFYLCKPCYRIVIEVVGSGEIR